jgi:predicted RNase H-like HicB family nuclease
MLNTNILIEKDIGGGFILSVPSVQGLHADGDTLEDALKNFGEVVDLLKEHYGQTSFRKILNEKPSFYGVINYDMQYA